MALTFENAVKKELDCLDLPSTKIGTISKYLRKISALSVFDKWQVVVLLCALLVSKKLFLNHCFQCFTHFLFTAEVNKRPSEDVYEKNKSKLKCCNWDSSTVSSVHDPFFRSCLYRGIQESVLWNTLVICEISWPFSLYQHTFCMVLYDSLVLNQQENLVPYCRRASLMWPGETHFNIPVKKQTRFSQHREDRGPSLMWPLPWATSLHYLSLKLSSRAIRSMLKDHLHYVTAFPWSHNNQGGDHCTSNKINYSQK